MTRLTTTALALVLAGGVVLAHGGAQTTGQTTTPPPTTPKPATPPAAQAPAPKPVPPPPPFPAGATIAYVQMQVVIAESKFGKCGSDIIKGLQDKMDAAVAAKQREVQAQQQKMQAQQGLVTEAVMTQMQRDLDRMTREGQALATQLQSDRDNKNQDLILDFQNKVGPILEALRKDKDLSFILSAESNGAIVAANTALDLSLELVKRLDAQYPDCLKKTGS
jgi:Skp family chaperone for outer membrane proteins